jgi:chemotaxis protein MotB
MMRSRTIAVGLIAVSALALLGGCCGTEQDYQKALKAQRLAREELLKSQSALQECRADRQTLQAELDQANRQIANRDQRIASLEGAYQTVVGNFNELEERYEKLANRDAPPVGGPVDVVLPIKLDTALKALQSQNPDLMDYKPEYGMVKLKADLTFDKGSADVKESAKPALKKLAQIMRTPDAAPFYVYVAGHTDDIPLRKPATIAKHGSNWGLSMHRAGSVVKELFQAGMQQRRLGAMGFSMYHPVEPNAPGRKGNPANRRVEIWIVPPNRFLTVKNGLADSGASGDAAAEDPSK